MHIHPSKAPKADIVNEASAWFIEFRAGEVTGSDRSRFDQWLRRSPEHIQAYLEIAAGWAELPTSDPQGRIDVTALIQRARATPDENVVALSPPAAMPREQRRLTASAWAASLAGVTLVVGLAVWAFLYQDNTYHTGVGEQRVVRLTDGSTVELNALSSIRVQFSQDSREVDMKEGQALFHVAKDRVRPFIVRSDGTTVRAVGTQFDVYRKREGTVVTVLEGRVAVAEVNRPAGALTEASPISEPIFLAAGEQITVPQRDSVRSGVKPKRADVAIATAWVQKRLIFEETPLADVAEEFNRYNTRRLLIVDPKLRSVGISGVYSSTDPDSLLGFLRAQPNLQLHETDREIRVALRETK